MRAAIFGFCIAVVLLGCESALKKNVDTRDYQAIEELLRQGNDPNYFWEMSDGYTAYGDAVANGDIRAIELFVEYGYGPFENSPYLAVKHGQQQIVPYLVQHGADINAPGPNPFNTGQFIPAVIPPLGLAVLEANVNAIKLLLGQGAISHSEVCKCSPGYYSALHIASQLGHTEIVELLSSSGSDVNLVVYEMTPIALAAKFGHLDTVKVLASHGAYISYDDRYPQPIELALGEDRDDVVFWLQSQGVRRPESFDYAQLMSDTTEVVVGLAIIAAGIAIAVESTKYSGSYTALPASSSPSNTTPREMESPVRETVTQSSCTSDFSCGTGYSCVKRPYRNSGVCMKSVDEYGARTYKAPSLDSVGPNTNPHCLTNADCPTGFRCDLKYQACVR